MQNEDTRALNAVWKSESESHSEKLVLAHLVTKHELGEKFSSGWKPVEAFITDFQDRWCDLRELASSTQLSPTKIDRAIQTLVARDLIKITSRPAKLGKRKKLAEGEQPPTEQVIALTLKIFNRYRQILVTGPGAETASRPKRQSA